MTLGNFIQIHKYRDKRRLSVGCHQGKHLILNHLDALLDFAFYTHFRHACNQLVLCLYSLGFQFLADLPAELVAAYLHKRCKVGERDALTAVLGACNLGNGLGGDITGRGKAVGLFNHGLADDGAVLKHVFQIDKAAVVHMLRKIIGIMKMNNTLFMSLRHVFGEKKAFGNILADFAGHVIPLHTVDNRIFVGVFLQYLFIVAL